MTSPHQKRHGAYPGKALKGSREAAGGASTWPARVTGGPADPPSACLKTAPPLPEPSLHGRDWTSWNRNEVSRNEEDVWRGKYGKDEHLAFWRDLQCSKVTYATASGDDVDE